MAARRQLKVRFGLAQTVVKMVLIVRDFLIEWWQIGIDQQVMMAGICLLDPRRCHPRAAQAHTNPEFAARNDLSVSRPDDVDLRVRWHRLGIGRGNASQKRPYGNYRDEQAGPLHVRSPLA